MAHPSHLSLLLPSFLVGTLKYAGPIFAPRTASAFLAAQGKEREVFLPFFYKWFDDRQWAQDNALRLIRFSVEHEHLPAPRVFHAPFLGRRSSPLRYRRNLSDPTRLPDHARMLQRECAFLGRVRREFGITEPVLYVIHLGQRIGISAGEAVKTAIAALKPSLEVARAAGVILAIENVADRLRDQLHTGARLSEVEDAIGALGGGNTPASPVGWTFDIAHALLAHGGDVDAVRRGTESLLSAMVHIHVNSPRLHLSEREWSDQHEAPTAGAQSLWTLFRLACTAPRFRQFRTMTYEVSWALPLLRPLLGGSRLRDVIQGYELVRQTALTTLAELDGRDVVPDAAPGAASAPSSPWVLGAPGALAHRGT